jgi:SAM-dependent methyltransferase
MANFRPLKQHMLLCLDRFIAQYGLRGPFLEIGCGRGYVSAHLVERHGWSGVAVDFSDAAIVAARARLARHPEVAVHRQALAEVRGRFACILMWDVLEHIDDDRGALYMIERLLAPGGHLLLAVPSNPREWRWDDDFYGHVRRYTEGELRAKIAEAGLEPEVFWDFTFPLFWALRRVYTRVKKPAVGTGDRIAATKASSTVNAWDLPVLSAVLDRAGLVWAPLNRLQFRYFRHATARGHEFFALARKPAPREDTATA